MEYKKVSLNLPFDLYNKLTDDADVSDRTIGGQIKYVLKNYYGPHPSPYEEVVSPEVEGLRDDSEVEVSEDARVEHIEVHKESAKKLAEYEGKKAVYSSLAEKGSPKARVAAKKAIEEVESKFKPMFKGKASKTWETALKGDGPTYKS